MVLTNRETIRDVVLFPLLKPQAVEVDEQRMEKDVEKLESDLRRVQSIVPIRPMMFILDKDGSLRIFEV
jgi:hypothetical protein